jgi:hypothetical protein
MDNEIRLDFSKYAGTYSVIKAKELISKMEQDIKEAKKDIEETSVRLKEKKKIADYQKAFKHNKDIPYIQFEEGNEYQFGMDFGFWQNIPSNVRFYPVRIFNNNERVQFIGIGYGILEEHKEKFGLIGDYGNGFISVSASQIPHLMEEVKSKLLTEK